MPHLYFMWFFEMWLKPPLTPPKEERKKEFHLSADRWNSFLGDKLMIYWSSLTIKIYVMCFLNSPPWEGLGEAFRGSFYTTSLHCLHKFYPQLPEVILIR